MEVAFELQEGAGSSAGAALAKEEAQSPVVMKDTVEHQSARCLG